MRFSLHSKFGRWLKRWQLILLAGMLWAPQARADSGIFQAFAVLNTGSGSTYYDLNGTTQNTQTSNPDLNGTNLGTFAPTGTLVLNGGQLKTYKTVAAT